MRNEQDQPVTTFKITVVPEDRLSLATISVLNSDNTFRGPPAPGDGPSSIAEQEFLLEGFRPQTVRSEEGEIETSGLEDREYRILVGAPHYGVATTTFQAASDRAVRMVLDRSDCRETLVVDRKTGQTVEGAHAAPAPAFVEGPYAKLWPAWPSGVDGQMNHGCPPTLLGLPAARVVAAFGYAPAVFEKGAAPGPEVMLGPGARIVGTAYGADEQPLVAHRIVVRAAGFVRRAQVDASGEFEVAGLPAGQADLQLFDSQGRSWVSGIRLRLEADEVRRVALGPGQRLRLQILLSGEPWAEVAVMLVAVVDDELVPVARGESGGDGIVILGVPGGYEGELALTVCDGAQLLSAPLPEKGMLARLKDSFFGEDAEQTIRVDIPGRWIAGRVVDDDTGEGLASRRIAIDATGQCRGMAVEKDGLFAPEALEGLASFCTGYAATTGTGKDGRFDLFAPEKGRTLTVSEPFLPHAGSEYESFNRKLSSIPPGEPVEIRLRAASVVEVRVADSSGRVPAGCSVSWRQAHFGPGTNGGYGGCGKDGFVRFAPPPDEPVLFVAEAPGLARAVEGPVTLPPRGKRSIRLILQPGGTIRLRARSLPRAGGRLYVPPGTLRDAAGRDWTTIAFPRFTSDMSEAIFDRLPPGQWIVSVGDERRKLRLEAGQELSVDLGGV